MAPVFASLALIAPKLRHSHNHSHSYAQSAHTAKRGGMGRKGSSHQLAHECNLKDFTQQKEKKKTKHIHKLKNKEVHAPPHSLFLHLGADSTPPSKLRSFLLPLFSWSFYRAWVFSSTGSPVTSGCPLESSGLTPLRTDSLSEILLSRGKRRKS